jgi:hypothetical protein
MFVWNVSLDNGCKDDSQESKGEVFSMLASGTGKISEELAHTESGTEQ